MKKYFLITILFVTTISFSQNTSSNLVKKIESVLSDNFFTSTTIALEVYNLSTDRLLYSKNSKLLLHPASNQKILTTLTALNFLDSAYAFNTEIFYTGNIIDSTLIGDVYVLGGGDPEFTIEDMDSLAQHIKQSGIKSIEGNFYGDVSMFDSLYWGKGWMWDDNPYAFSPYLSPLIIEKSTCKIFYSPGKIGEPVNIRLYPETNFYSLENTSLTINEDTSDFNITRDWIHNKNNIIVDGPLSYKSRSDSVYRNISEPVKFFLTILKERMSNCGINLTGWCDTLSLPKNSISIYKTSQPLDTVLYYMNKNSDNLNAEMVLRALGNKYFGKRCSADDGIKMIDSLIYRLGMKPKNYSLVDGSGLSFYNLISVELLTSAMKYTYKEKPDLFRRFYNTLPIAGIDGTLKNRLRSKGVKNNLRAKTGTLSGVSCLSGIVKSKKGNDILFSMMMQNYTKSSRSARQKQDNICKIIYEEL